MTPGVAGERGPHGVGKVALDARDDAVAAGMELTAAGVAEMAAWFKQAKEFDPQARLFINDFGIGVSVSSRSAAP